MKRIGNLFNRIISYENLVRADKKARLGKTKRYGVKKFEKKERYIGYRIIQTE